MCTFSLQAIDFVDKLLRYDHQDRPTAKEAMVKYPIPLYLFILLRRKEKYALFCLMCVLFIVRECGNCVALYQLFS